MFIFYFFISSYTASFYFYSCLPLRVTQSTAEQQNIVPERDGGAPLLPPLEIPRARPQLATRRPYNSQPITISITTPRPFAPTSFSPDPAPANNFYSAPNPTVAPIPFQGVGGPPSPPNQYYSAPNNQPISATPFNAAAPVGPPSTPTQLYSAPSQQPVSAEPFNAPISQPAFQVNPPSPPNQFYSAPNQPISATPFNAPFQPSGPVNPPAQPNQFYSAPSSPTNFQSTSQPSNAPGTQQFSSFSPSPVSFSAQSAAAPLKNNNNNNINNNNHYSSQSSPTNFNSYSQSSESYSPAPAPVFQPTLQVNIGYPAENTNSDNPFAPRPQAQFDNSYSVPQAPVQTPQLDNSYSVPRAPVVQQDKPSYNPPQTNDFNPTYTAPPADPRPSYSPPPREPDTRPSYNPPPAPREDTRPSYNPPQPPAQNTQSNPSSGDVHYHVHVSNTDQLKDIEQAFGDGPQPPAPQRDPWTPRTPPRQDPWTERPPQSPILIGKYIPKRSKIPIRKPIRNPVRNPIRTPQRPVLTNLQV